MPPRNLPLGAAVELWHEGRLHVGNVRGLATRTALQVELSTGQHIKVDGGQLVDVWPQLSDVPNGVEAWSAVHAEAATLLRHVPPHVLDLQPVWKRLTMRQGGRTCIGPDNVSSALFDNEHVGLSLIHI